MGQRVGLHGWGKPRHRWVSLPRPLKVLWSLDPHAGEGLTDRKIPWQCPLVLLAKVRWKEGEAF